MSNENKTETQAATTNTNETPWYKKIEWGKVAAYTATFLGGAAAGVGGILTYQHFKK